MNYSDDYYSTRRQLLTQIQTLHYDLEGVSPTSCMREPIWMGGEYRHYQRTSRGRYLYNLDHLRQAVGRYELAAELYAQGARLTDCLSYAEDRIRIDAIRYDEPECSCTPDAVMACPACLAHFATDEIPY